MTEVARPNVEGPLEDRAAPEGAVPAGSRLRCGTCGAEVVVVRALAGVPWCCDAPMGPRA